MSINKKIWLSALVSVALVYLGPVCQAGVHTLKPGVNLRNGPHGRSPVLARLDHNQSIDILRRRGPWLEVRTPTGGVGHVHHSLVSRVWIKVLKAERRLYLMSGRRVIKTYRVALSPANPLGDKIKLGDGGTPEGRFFICEMLPHPKAARYGARSMRLSYPNIEDARRGLRAGLISYRTYLAIVKAIKRGGTPPQNTRLGGSIRIHGGGSSRDWTLGCIALDEKDVKDLYSRVKRGVRVEVYKNAAAYKKINAAGYLSRMILAGAKKQLLKKAYYSAKATAEYRLKYPLGDIRPDWAVCTDVVIRALRFAGVDLQALVHEDAIRHPRSYRRWIRRPNYNIDHRRSRNLQLYFSRQALVLPMAITPGGAHSFRPGDIVVMDTGIKNGTIYDHIGIVARASDERGVPLVINIWTVGLYTSAMSLLGRDYPKVVGHFRLTHPFDYQ